MGFFKNTNIYFLLSLILPLVLFSTVVKAETDTPNVYQVTVNSMDLCEDSACSAFVRLGNKSKAFDIAGVSASGSVGTYVEEIVLEVGKAYSHARWNLNRTMTLKGTVAIDGVGNCATSTNGTAGTESVNAYNAAAQTEANLNLFMTDLLKGGDGTWPTAAQYTSKGVQLVDDDFPSATTFNYIKKLTSMYVVTESIPEIIMSFDVTNRLGAGYNGTGSAQNGVPNGKCYYWIEDPSPKITIK